MSPTLASLWITNPEAWRCWPNLHMVFTVGYCHVIYSKWWISVCNLDSIFTLELFFKHHSSSFDVVLLVKLFLAIDACATLLTVERLPFTWIAPRCCLLSHVFPPQLIFFHCMKYGTRTRICRPWCFSHNRHEQRLEAAMRVIDDRFAKKIRRWRDRTADCSLLTLCHGFLDPPLQYCFPCLDFSGFLSLEML